MNKLLDKPIASLVFTLAVGYIIFSGSGFVSSIIVKSLPDSFQTDFYLKNIVLKFFLLLFSIAAMVLIPKMEFKDFGFKLPKKTNYFKLLWRTVAITIGGLIVYGILFMGILRNIFGDTNEMGFPDSDSILKMIVAVWLWSSICEEVFNRGLLQSLLGSFQRIKFCKLSLSVWISGILFGAMHFSVFNISNSLSFVLFIVFNTTTLGVLAAYYREKSESLLPAIFVHILGNIAGSFPLLLRALLG